MNFSYFSQEIGILRSSHIGNVSDLVYAIELAKPTIIEPFDHATVLNKNSPHLELGKHLKNEGHHVIFTKYQPTCENMLIDFASKISTKLPPHIHLHSLRLFETENSYGEWFAEDNI